MKTNPDSHATRPKATVGAITVGVLAAAVTIIFVVESHRHDVFRYPLVDGATYYRQARTVAGGDSPTGVLPYWQPPLYPYVLAGLLRVGITGTLALRLLHATLLTAAAAMLTFLLARRHLPHRAALLAGIVAAGHGPLLFFASQLLPAALATVMLATALLLTLRLYQRPSLRLAAACGLVYGFATITVANTLLIAFLAAGWIAWQRRANNTEATRLAATLLGTTLLCIAPVALRNVVVSGEVVPISTNAGINLHIGNGPGADQRQAVRPGIDWDRMVAEPFRSGAAKTESDADRVFKKRVLCFAASHPVAATRDLARKTFRLLNAREIPRNVDLYAFSEWSVLLRALVWRLGPFAFPSGVLMPLAIVGLLTAFRRGTEARFLACATLLYAASIVLFFPASRYALPLVPASIVLAALGVQAMLISRRRAGLVAVLATAVVVVNWPLVFPTDGIPFDAELHLYTGVAMQTRGNHAEAVDHYHAALDLAPEHADTWFYLGTAERERGRIPQAIAAHRAALDNRPDHHRAMQDLAVLLHERGQTADAVTLLRDCVRLDPGNRRAIKNLAVGLLALGETEEARDWLQRCGEAP